MSLAFDAPFVSGKDSLNNITQSEGRVIAIPHTLLVSAMAVVGDVQRTISMDLKAPGNLLYVVGNTFAELAGSEYCEYLQATGERVPEVRTETARTVMLALSDAIAAGLVVSCHDMSEGGLAVAAAEMAFAGDLGASVELAAVPLGERIVRDDILLFSESNTRFVAEVAPAGADEFERRMAGVACARVGIVMDTEALSITGLSGDVVVAIGLKELKAAWQRPLDW